MVKKSTLYMIISVFLFTILLTGCAGKETKSLQESAKVSNKVIQSKLIKYMNDYSKKNGFSGTILISKDDDILLNRGYGMADYDKKVANTPHTVFQIASVTKQFTATAILMLQENKLLSVQDPISKYIPDYPNGDKIRIYNLLTHTSGIPDYIKLAESMETGKHTYTPEEVINLFKNKPLDFDTGTSFNYSNSNYILLGYIIEKVSNMKYEDYIEKNILKPLKLNETGFLSKKPQIKNKATGYSILDRESNSYIPSYEMEDSLLYSAAGFCSTDEDLYRWEKALFAGKLIKKESLNEMFTPHLDNYGYGWFIGKSAGGDKIIFHSGNALGFTSFVSKDVDKNYILIILSNKHADNSLENIIDGVSQIIEGK
jgi:CubicO group peptidase (beta-lactamase class C family)